MIPEKVESYCHVIAGMERDAKALRDEEKRLAARRKVRENNAKNMKTRLHDALESMDVKKMEAGNWTVTRAKSPASLLVGSEEHIPLTFFIQQLPRLDKKALLSEVKDGLTIEGVQLVDDSTHLRIR